MKLHKLLRDTEHTLINGDLNVEINNICYDSRKVDINSVFICIKGSKSNGHNFINKAIKNGAAAIIIEEEFQLESENIALIKVGNTKSA